MITPTKMQEVADDLILGKEPRHRSNECYEFAESLKADIERAKAQGLVIDIPREFEIDTDDGDVGYGGSLELPPDIGGGASASEPNESFDDLTPKSKSQTGCGANATGGGGFQTGNNCAGKASTNSDSNRLRDTLAETTLPKFLKSSFEKDLDRTITNLPEKAAHRLNAIKSVSWSTNTAGIAKSLTDDGNELPAGITPGGAWDATKGKLYLASDKHKSGKGGAYAHELAHVVDHNNGASKFSDSSDWKEAWKAEIGGGALTSYAATNAEEGFAEFARLAWLSKDTEHKAAVKKTYPKASAVFEKAGLI